MTDDGTSRPRMPVAAMIAGGFFFNGVIFASTLNYWAIVGVETLGIPNSAYAIILMVSSLGSAAASVILGYVSDRLHDRRVLVLACAVTGTLGFGIVYMLRSQLAFIVVMCTIMPFGFAVFSQSMSFARVHFAARGALRADFMISVMRTIFSVAWAVVPPFIGILAASTSVFEVYAVAAAASFTIAVIYATMLVMDRGRRVEATETRATTEAPRQAGMQIDPAIAGGIGGWLLIAIAIQLTTVTSPLLVTSTLGGGYDELGLFAGLAAALELPFMLFWGYALRWLKKHTVIVVAALIYAVYLFLLSRASTVTDVLWLQVINAPATGGLMTIPISYLQEAIRGRIGLSTSLLDVARVVAVMSGAALFGALTTTSADYPLLFVVAAGLSATGALAMFAAHRLLRSLPAEGAAS